MADRENFIDDGYAREFAIAKKLEDYLEDCLGPLDPPAVVDCKVDAQAESIQIRCTVDVDDEILQEAESLLTAELRIVSQVDGVAAEHIEHEAVIPAIVRSDDDDANQIFRVVLRKVNLPRRPHQESVLPMTQTHSSNPNFGRPALDIEHVIVLVHGIKDIGAWQNKVSKHLVQEGTVVEQIRYGLHPAFRFLFPIDRSGKPVQRVVKRLRALRNQYRNARLSVIAHSFGTYVVLKAMEADSDLEFWKIVFCGSVADDQFEWSELKRRVGDRERPTRDFILNDCGTGDVWPILGASFGWHYGMAGVTGFSEGFVTNRFHRATGGTKGGHGLYFDPEFVNAKWRPFLIDDVAPADGDGEQGEHLPFFIRWLYHDWLRWICKAVVLIAWIAVLLLASGFIWISASYLIGMFQQFATRFATNS